MIKTTFQLLELDNEFIVEDDQGLHFLRKIDEKTAQHIPAQSYDEIPPDFEIYAAPHHLKTNRYQVESSPELFDELAQISSRVSQLGGIVQNDMMITDQDLADQHKQVVGATTDLVAWHRKVQAYIKKLNPQIK